MTVKPLLGGRYQFIKILGSETDDATYLVGDTQIQGHPKCVIKRLSLSGKGPRTLRFMLVLLRRKAEALKQIGNHEQIPKILGYFEDEDSFCLVEEFIPGRPLSLILKPRQPLPETVVIQLLKEILKILTIVHSWGVIHRCITPSNIIQRQTDGKLVLTGFGIFREISAQGNQTHSPIDQAHVSNRQVYLSLNHLNGERHFNGDIYAVGMIGVQALTGLSTAELAKLRNSWRQNGTAASAHPHWHQYASASLGLQVILDRMINENVELRYQTVAEVLEDLRKLDGAVITSENSSSPPPSAPVAISPEPSNVLESVDSGGQRPVSPPKLAPTSAQPSSFLGDEVLVSPQGPLQDNSKPRRRWQGVAVGGSLLLILVGLIWFNRLPQRSLAHISRYQGKEEFKQGNYREAIAHYSDALNQVEDGYTYLQRGLAYQNLQEWRDAQDDFSQAIQLNPQLEQAFYYRGNIRFQFGDRQGALEDYTAAITLDPKAVKAYVNRGSVRGDLGDETGAIEDYSIAIQIDPSTAAAYLNRCLSRSNLDDHRGAIADCSQAINLTPNSVLAYQNRGLARRRLGDISGALEDFNIAINLDPDDPDPYYNRGLARLELGDRAGAIADYTEAINRKADHALAYYDRGVVRAIGGDQIGAIADLRASAKLCLDAGRQACYEDAQYQIIQLESGNDINLDIATNDLKNRDSSHLDDHPSAYSD